METKIPKSFFSHPLIKENILEKRLYQELMAAEAIKRNTICVLPTGLGKTALGIILSAERLTKFPHSKILVLAPTKPLVEQHFSSFQNILNLKKDKFALLTGKTSPKDRESFWEEKTIFFATPQVVQNDLITGKLGFENYSMVLFDECHRAVKDYSYVYVAKKYIKNAKNPRILGLTASPGGSEEKIKQVMSNLFAESFEVRNENDPDVLKYVQKKDIKWIHVPLTKHFEKLQKYLESAYRDRTHSLKKMNLIKSVRSSKRELLAMRGHMISKLVYGKDQRYLIGLSLLAGAMKVQHALELLETQGINPLYKYIEKLKKDPSKAAKSLFNDKNFSHAVSVCEWMYKNNYEHPKLDKLKQVLKEELKEKVIVFTQYRNTVDLICKEINAINGVVAHGFKGQKEGFTQKKQAEILESFRNNEFNVLVSTSVGEEGLDIPLVDLVIFYEPIPSEIRSIQRMGRTARHRKGKIIVLIAEKTRDEFYFWSAYHKQKKMQNTLRSLKFEKDIEDGKVVSIPEVANKVESQRSIFSYSENEEVIIYVDDREKKIAEILSDKVKVAFSRLDVADFLVSSRVAVERKTAEDFVNSIIDQRLFNQLNELKRNFQLPILIIEGKDLFQRNIHPNAVFGALSSVALDYHIPILWSSNLEETANILVSLAKREQLDKRNAISLRGKKISPDTKELQKFIVSGIPFVDNILSERLLEKFGTVKNVFNADLERLQDVQGIGEKKAGKIYNLINLEFEKNVKEGDES